MPPTKFPSVPRVTSVRLPAVNAARAGCTTTPQEPIPAQVPTGEPTHIPRRLSVLIAAEARTRPYGPALKDTLTLPTRPAEVVAVRAVTTYEAVLGLAPTRTPQRRCGSSLVTAKPQRSWADVGDELDACEVGTAKRDPLEQASAAA